MNKLTIALFLLISGIFSSTAIAQGGGTLNLSSGNEDEITIIEFEEPEFHYGKVTEGDSVFHTFVFRNAGSADLLIEAVKPPCECTSADWPKERIKPGAKGEILVKFDSKNKSGEQIKYVSVVYNGMPPVERILLTCEVVPRTGETPAPEKNQEGKE